MQIYMKDGKALWMNKKAITLKAIGETWVLNEMTALGRDFVNPFVSDINFVSNGVNYQSVTVTSAGPIDGDLLYDNFLVYYITDGGETTIWNNQAYRTITFLEAPTGNLLTWLQTNGTKQ